MEKKKQRGTQAKETGFNWRDLRIALATAFDYSQSTMDDFVGIGGRAVRNRFHVNGPWIRQVADCVRTLRQKEQVAAESITKEELDDRLEERLGLIMAAIDEGLSGKDLKLRVATAFQALEQIRPKKTIVESQGKVLHAHMHTLQLADESTAQQYQKLFGRSLALVERSRALPGGEGEAPVVDLDRTN